MLPKHGERDSVSAYVHIKRDSTLPPLYKHFGWPSQFHTHLMDDLYIPATSYVGNDQNGDTILKLGSWSEKALLKFMETKVWLYLGCLLHASSFLLFFQITVYSATSSSVAQCFMSQNEHILNDNKMIIELFSKLNDWFGFNPLTSGVY